MSADRYLTSAEAAARLGVKRATIYAYVSRGLLTRTMAADGKSSLFERAEVEALRSRRTPRRGTLNTVVVSSVTNVVDGAIHFKGRSLADLIESDSTIESIADLLWAATKWPMATERHKGQGGDRSYDGPRPHRNRYRSIAIRRGNPGGPRRPPDRHKSRRVGSETARTADGAGRIPAPHLR